MRRPNFIVASSAAAVRSVMISIPELLHALASAPAFGLAVCGSTTLPRADRIKTHALPGGVRSVFQIAGEVGKLLDLRGKYGGLHTEMLIVRGGTQHLRDA